MHIPAIRIQTSSTVLKRKKFMSKSPPFFWLFIITYFSRCTASSVSSLRKFPLCTACEQIWIGARFCQKQSSERTLCVLQGSLVLMSTWQYLPTWWRTPPPSSGASCLQSQYNCYICLIGFVVEAVSWLITDLVCCLPGWLFGVWVVFAWTIGVRHQ